MRPRINLSLQVAAGILALIAPCFLAAQGAPAVSLEEQLSAQYTLVKMGSDSSGPAVVEPGTILAIQKDGILGVPYGNMNMLPAKYQDGTSILRLQRPAIRPLAWGRKCVAFRQMQQHKRAGRETDNDPLVSGRRKGLPLKN